MGEALLWVGAAPALVSLRMQTSWSKALGAPHQQRMKGLDRAHHSMHVQPLWSLMGTGNDFRLRNYGFTDLPPSLPLPRADLETRIYESKRRRRLHLQHTSRPSSRKNQHPLEASAVA